jgi:G patch domain-containing protein 1
MWKPHKDLCKRFNVPEPFGGMMIDEKPKKRTRFSVFDYLEVPVNTRKDFVTPVIIPKQSDLTDRQLSQKKHDLTSSPYTHPPPPITKPASKVPIQTTTPRLTAKEFFNEDTLKPVVVPSFVSRTEVQSTVAPVEEQQSATVPAPAVFLTELETKVVESKNKKPEEKQDLFKSIFCDSSDDEDEDDDKEAATTSGQQTTEADKIKLIESIVAIKPASEFNVLRNQSPPRGIFKNLFTRKVKIPEVDPSKATTRKTDSVIPETTSGSIEVENTNTSDLYGPKIPDKIIRMPSDSSSSDSDDSDIDEKLLKHLKRKRKNEISVEEGWVEKDKLSPKSEKKKKKKSDKDKHKKSKKHKKDKKKHKKRKKD